MRDRLIRQPAVAAFLLTLAVRSPSLFHLRAWDDDETYLGSAGRMLTHGGVLYRDVIDRKPPIVPYAYAWLGGGSSLLGIRLAIVVLVALNGLAVRVIARRLGASADAALLAGALAIVGSALHAPADAQAANFEVWGLLPATLGVLCALSARDSATAHHRWAWAFASGAAVAVATNAKQPYVFTFLVVAFVFVARRDALAIVASAAGAALTTALFAAAFWHGYWKWVWFDNGDYLKVGALHVVGLGAVKTLEFLLMQIPLAYGAARAVRARAIPPAVLVWIVAALVGVASGLRFFGHYYQQVVPALAIAAAFGFAALTRARQHLVVAIGAVGAIALLLLTFSSGLRGLDPAPQQLVALLRTVPSDAPVLVWGNRPDAAYEAHRRPVAPFVHQGYLTGLWADTTAPADAWNHDPYRARWEQFSKAWRDDPPAVVVDASSLRNGWRDVPITQTPMRAWLAQCYDRVAPVAGLPAWRLHAGCVVSGP